MDTHISPYELFGLSHKATLDEVRRAYYEMALLAHPDKGGSAADMHLINAAYAWIKKGLEYVIGDIVAADVPYEDLLKEYTDTNGIASAMPSLLDIEGETVGLPRGDFPSPDDFLYRLTIHSWMHEPDEVRDATTVKEYAASKIAEFSSPVATPSMYRASIPHGYIESIGETTVGEGEGEEKVRAFSRSQDVVVYDDPSFMDLHAAGKVAPTAAGSLVPDMLEDYSINGAADYELAFSELKISGSDSDDAPETAKTNVD
jgi:curved DNA-binding protein CbpA